MTTAAYMDGRVKYRRPQAIILSDNPGTLVASYSATGKTASISLGTASVFVLNGVEGIYPGQTIEKTGGTGAFAVGAVVESVDRTASTITLSANHLTAGSVVFKTGNSSYVPTGVEFENFIILSDHNRSDLDFSPERIEKRERMINGRMRSYHVADKQKLSVSWDNLPSRAYPILPEINSNGVSSVEPYTVDGGAGGNDLLKWYEDHVGSFWVFLAYDKYPVFGTDEKAYGHMAQYNQVLEMYASDFSHKVSKRGILFDMWNVSISLEEA
jgi:hypothetical protein